MDEPSFQMFVISIAQSHIKRKLTTSLLFSQDFRLFKKLESARPRIFPFMQSSLSCGQMTAYSKLFIDLHGFTC